MMRIALLLLCTSGAVMADSDRLIATTRQAFPQIPVVEIVSNLGDLCGGGATGQGIYCPTERRIYLVDHGDAQTLYTLAHLYGHALQVTYGVADLALAAIRADRAREAELRSMVTRQVDCLAGVLVARAGLDMPPLAEVFATEPMTHSHWGRNPVREGPRVSIGLTMRAEAFSVGQEAADPVVCSFGEMAADLIVQADQF